MIRWFLNLFRRRKPPARVIRNVYAMRQPRKRRSF